MSRFQIYSMPAAAGEVALCPIPGRGGIYAEDLREIEAWGANLVVSMTQGAEMAGICENLGEDLHAMGIEWVHFPVADYQIPTPLQEAAWRDLCMRATDILDAGGKVLFHCKGGCGRSGMAVLRVLISTGLAADEALAMLRNVRACAVETEAQLAWARK